MKKVLLYSLALCAVLAGPLPAAAQKGRSVAARSAVLPQTAAATAQAVFDAVEAYSDGQAVFVRWRMATEQNNIGFYVYRRNKGLALEQLAPERMIPGSKVKQGPARVYGSEYAFTDLVGNYRGTYLVEAVLADGTVVRSAYVVPQYVTDLRTVAGDELDTAPNTRRIPSIESSAAKLDRELASEEAAYRVSADPATHMDVISKPGVRIGVRREGWYRVTRAQLQAAGFNVNSDTTLWQLYVEGVQQAINIGPNADYVEFYGSGVDTPETDIRVYYLIVGNTAGKRVVPRSVRPSLSTVISPNYPQTAVRKERTFFVDDLLNGDAENYFGRAIGTGATTYTFSLTGVDFTSADATLRVSFQGYSNTTHSIELFLNGQALAPATGEQVFPYSKTYTIPTSMLVEGNNALQMRSAGPSGDFNLFDSVSVGYRRKYQADQDRVSFFTPNYKIANLTGFTTSDIRILDITDINNPIELTNFTVQNNGGTYSATVPAARGRVLYAVSGAGIMAPHSVSANDPSLLSVNSTQADLVIISYKDYLPQAETWANYRRGQGFSVKVVEVSEIYDEFNYGSLSSASIRSFLQYAVQNWQTPPRYVLLLGEGSFDSRNYEGTGYWNQVPAHLSDTVFLTTASDEWLGDFNEDGLSEVAIGRVASRNTTAVTTVYNKVVTFEALQGNNLDRGALFAFDFPQGYDFQAMSTRLRNQLPQTVNATMVFRGDANSDSALITSMNSGKFLVNYSGHGTTGSWGGNPVFFNVFSVPNLTNASAPSVYTMLTCLNGYYHNIVNDSFAEVLTKAANGGAVSAWASSGLTTPDVQEIMGQRFYSQVAAGNIPRLGDLIRDAKSVVPGGSPVRFSWVLIGDPMLKVR